MKRVEDVPPLTDDDSSVLDGRVSNVRPTPVA